MKIEVKANNALSDIERALSIPVMEIAQRLAVSIRARIELGEAARGHFRPLGADSRERSGHGLFWVSPDRPQPAGYLSKPSTGQLAGWAGYRSYKAYTEALGSPPRKFKITRQLLDSMKIRPMGPGRVKIAFYGTHKRAKQPPKIIGTGGSNSAVAFLASRDERDPMLMFTFRELADVARFVREHVNELAEAASAQGAKSRRRAPRARR